MLFKKLKAKFKKKSNPNYFLGLSKSRSFFSEKLKFLTKKYHTINPEYFQELEELLVASDISWKLVLNLIETMQKIAWKRKITAPDAMHELLVEQLTLLYDENNPTAELSFDLAKITVIMIIGTNGTGKTTSTAKLAYYLTQIGKNPLMIAADTFRAGAVEQLEQWSEKHELPCFSLKATKDPAAVIFQGLDFAISNQFDTVIIDTAGRLDNKINLMQEIAKINKIIEKKLAKTVDEIILTIDATTGQNGLLQAEAFAKILPLTGIILTKMDGSAKGGIVFTIKNDLNLPVKLLGLGEGITDLVPFQFDEYLYHLLGDIVNENSDA